MYRVRRVELRGNQQLEEYEGRKGAKGSDGKLEVKPWGIFGERKLVFQAQGANIDVTIIVSNRLPIIQEALGRRAVNSESLNGD